MRWNGDFRHDDASGVKIEDVILAMREQVMHLEQ